MDLPYAPTVHTTFLSWMHRYVLFPSDTVFDPEKRMSALQQVIRFNPKISTYNEVRHLPDEIQV